MDQDFYCEGGKETDNKVMDSKLFHLPLTQTSGFLQPRRPEPTRDSVLDFHQAELDYQSPS